MRWSEFDLRAHSDPSRSRPSTGARGTRRTTAIKETAAEKDFYTAINTEGEKDGKTEHLLSHIEGNAARAIRNILSPGLGLFPPQPQDRADLCLFLAFQKVRGKLTRKRIEMLGDLWARVQIPADMTSEGDCRRGAQRGSGLVSFGVAGDYFSGLAAYRLLACRDARRRVTRAVVRPMWRIRSPVRGRLIWW
jgi:hypothetical protein